VSRSMSMVSFMTQPLYPWGKRLRFNFNRRLGGEGAVGLNTVALNKDKSLATTGDQPTTLQYPNMYPSLVTTALTLFRL